jgi:hypothetical protein
MVTKYGMAVDEVDFEVYMTSMKNKVYKLLPLREESLEWSKYLTTIIIELNGLSELLSNQVYLISLLAKLEGLYKLEDFMLYRRTIFECLNLIDELR